MKTALVCVALLCALTVLGQVQAAPANVNAGQLVDRLKELLRQRHSHGAQVPYTNYFSNTFEYKKTDFDYLHASYAVACRDLRPRNV